MRRRNPESGFVLLMIYAMAAAVAIMLYMQLPRVAFEAQRQKEQLLIDRGQQYSRAVQLYVRKFQRFPQDIAALESTQNIRFLRKQYIDPMTGKNEWRIIHVGPGGIFTDSQVYSNQKKKDASAPQTFITEMQGIGGAANTADNGVNLATRRRPSDPANPQSNTTVDPNSGNASAPINGPVMVLPDGRIVPATPTGVPAPPPPPTPGQPGQPGQPAQPAQPGQPFQGGLPPGFQNQANTPPAGAANLINQILTTPRPQPGQPSQGAEMTGDFGNPGQSNTGVSAGQSLGGQVIGGGLAGVASKNEREGIKIYNDRSSYNQWEFVYDLSKDPTRAGGQGIGSTPATGANPTGNGSPVPMTPASPK